MSLDPITIADRLRGLNGLFCHLVFYPQVDSTQTAARHLVTTWPRSRERAPLPRNRPTLVVAETQTAGRGRGDRAWFSSDGSLTLTLIVPVRDTPVDMPALDTRVLDAAVLNTADLDAADLDAAAPVQGGTGRTMLSALPRIALAGGVAVCEAVGSLLRDDVGSPDEALPGWACSPGWACPTVASMRDWGLGVKWPNDVLLDDRKLAGLLGEVILRPEFEAPDRARPPSNQAGFDTSDGEVAWAVLLGIGLNINTQWSGAPEEVRRRATSLRAATGRTFDRTEALVRIVERVVRRIDGVLASPPANDGFRSGPHSADSPDSADDPGRDLDSWISCHRRLDGLDRLRGRHVTIRPATDSLPIAPARGDRPADVSGQAVGIAVTGALQIREEGTGLVRDVSGGEVVAIVPPLVDPPGTNPSGTATRKLG